MKPIMKRPFFGSIVAAAAGLLAAAAGTSNFNAPFDMPTRPMLTPTLGRRSSPVRYGPPPMSNMRPPSQRQRRKAMRRARAAGF